MIREKNPKPEHKKIGREQGSREIARERGGKKEKSESIEEKEWV